MVRLSVDVENGTNDDEFDRYGDGPYRQMDPSRGRFSIND